MVPTQASGIDSIRLRAGNGLSPGIPLPASVGATCLVQCQPGEGLVFESGRHTPPIGLKKTCLLASGIYSIRLKAGNGWSPGNPLPASVGASFLVQYQPGKGLVLSRAAIP